MTEHASHGRPPSFLRMVAPLLGLVLVGLIVVATMSSFEGGDPVPAAPIVSAPPPPVLAEAVDAAPAPALVEQPATPTPPPVRSEAEQLAERSELELRSADERELVRLRAAEGDGQAVAGPQFDWLPDRNDAAGVDVARRMARAARELMTEREDTLANQLLEAHVQERVGDPDAAISRCNQALDLEPRCGVAWIVRGWARLARGDVDGAELDLLRGARLSGDSAWAHIGLGRVAEERSQLDVAIAAYERALKVGGASNASVDHDADLRARSERLQARLAPR